jgi:gliding motility-associated peptidyl-prolyl isomerase
MKKSVILITFLLLIISCKSPEARKPVSVRSGSFMEESIQRNKKLHAEQKALFENYMSQHPEVEFITSTNGFWYFYNSEKSTDTLTAKFGDVVNYNHNVKSINDEVLYSKEFVSTRNYRMDQEELFSGLREGLKLMKTGETITFLFPSQKAFGYYGDDNKIGINMPIVCEVTVNLITKNK